MKSAKFKIEIKTKFTIYFQCIRKIIMEEQFNFCHNNGNCICNNYNENLQDILLLSNSMIIMTFLFLILIFLKNFFYDEYVKFHTLMCFCNKL